MDANIAGKGFYRILIANQVIGDLQRLSPERAAEPYCSAGFVDLQINGFAGTDFSAPDLTEASVLRVLEPIRATGVTSFCPTLVTGSLDLLERNLRTLERVRAGSQDFAASVPCYHMEGPYLSPGGAHGAHDPTLMRQPAWHEFKRLQEAAGGRIGVLTIAPELPGASELIERVSGAGVLVGIGHTDGSPADIHRAVRAGARLSTHLGNGCAEFIHRHQTPIWAQLVSDGLSASMICDGFHLPPELIQAIARLKGADGSILITDAIHVTGLDPGDYHLGPTPIRLLPSGQVITRTTPSSMAGSTLTMNRAVERFHTLGGVPLDIAIRAATANPARLLGPAYGLCGELEPGAPANLAIWTRYAAELQIDAVFLNGLRHEF
jgi:N-acetylglucosamine-6-phosphate deacetylase